MTDIYLITNLINGKQYVGKTSKGYLARFRDHQLAYSHGERQYLHLAMHKYGDANFVVELLDTVEDNYWQFWEMFYIKQWGTHYSQGGYNETWGGDNNPMDNPEVAAKHAAKCKSAEFRELQRKLSMGKKHSEATKELCRQNTLANLDICIAGFRAYNAKRQQKVGMLDDRGNVIIIFDSLSQAVHYISDNNPQYRFNSGDTSQIKYYADRFNKNGKRAKFLGHAWTLNV